MPSENPASRMTCRIKGMKVGRGIAIAAANIQILDDRRAVFMVASAAEIDHGVCSWLIWHADIRVVFL